jgi:hypothetical protein
VLTDIKQNEALGDIMTNRYSHGFVRNLCAAASIAPNVIDRVGRYRSNLFVLLCTLFVAALAVPGARAQQIGNNPNPGTGNLGQDTSPPFVVLQDYNPSAPLVSSQVEFPSAGTVTQVLFYAAGGASYAFNVYALSVANANENGIVPFIVDGAAVVSGNVPANGGGLQTVAVSFPAKAGDMLGFAGIGPSYPQAANDAVGSDATFATFIPGTVTGFTATPPSTTPGSTFSVSATGLSGGTQTTYAYISDVPMNQGRNYAIAVNFTPANAATYTIGGTVTGLTGTGAVVLQDNGGDNLTLSANGSFTFATPLAAGQTYYVTVHSSPTGLACAVTNPAGTVGAANVTNIQVNCSPTTTYSYSGKPFTSFNAGSAYTPSDSVSAALTMNGPLAANSGPTNLMALASFVSLTLSDGINVITVSFNNCSGGSCSGAAWVTTDANGNLSAWYLDATSSPGGGSKDIHTLYDPHGQFTQAYANLFDPQGTAPLATGEDEGSYSVLGGEPVVSNYGYEHSSPPGSFLSGGTGGTVVVTPTTCTIQNPCQVVPTTQLAVVTAPGVSLPSDPVITQTQCFVPADPRGANCGAVNGKPAKSLNIASLAQWCPGYGNEVIPSYACGASGPSGTGFWLNYGVAESLDNTNGLDIFDTFTPPANTNTPPCPPITGDRPGAYTYGIIIGGTRLASNTEEQHPESTLIDITDSCDNVHGTGPPGASVIGEGFQLVQADPAAKPKQTNQEILLTLANYDYVNTYIVAGLAKYPKNSPVETKLLLCLAESQILLNVGNYQCSSQRLYQCETLIQNTPVASIGPTKTPLRLPDPYGDLQARVLHQFFLTNTQIGGAPPISLLQQPAGGPYPGCPAL